MESRSNRPVLDERAVGQALEAMRAGQSLHQHPLSFFVSITSRLASPHVLRGDVAVQVAIFDYLSEIISSHLDYLRQQSGLPVLDNPKEALRQDFLEDNHELQAWALLYYRYIRVDQNLSMQDIAGLTSADGRTMRRRHKLGLSRLTQKLVTMEQGARQHLSRQRLKLALPAFYPPMLFGAESLKATAYHLLVEADPPHHIVLYGPPGIGKTALATALAHLLIGQDASHQKLDDLLWLDMPDLPTAVKALTVEMVIRLGLPYSPGDSYELVLRSYLSVHRVLIVLDGAETLLSHPSDAEALLDLLGPAKMLLTSRLKPPDHLWLHQILIPELSRNDAFSLLDSLKERRHSNDRDFTAPYDAIWQAVGGNPLALNLLGSASQFLPVSGLNSAAVVEQIYQQTWEALTPDERCVWLLPLLCESGLAYDRLCVLAGLNLEKTNRAIMTLVSRALFIPTSRVGTICYAHQTLARTFLIEQVRTGITVEGGYSAISLLRTAADAQVKCLIDSPDAEKALDVLHAAEILGFPADERWQFAYILAPQIVLAGLWQVWYDRLKNLSTVQHTPEREAWLNYMIGVALRWVGELNEARMYLQQALYAHNGERSEQADAMIELAVVNRYQARWDEAYQLSHRAWELYDQLQIQSGVERVLHEIAQMALETNTPLQALTWLSRLDQWSARTWGIASQTYLQLDQHTAALEAAQQALERLPVQHPNQGRAIAAFGQIFDSTGNSEAAVEYLVLALDLLEQSRDTLGYARVCNNLAVAYARQPVDKQRSRKKEIRLLFGQALEILEHVGDEIGLAVIRQNLDRMRTAD